MKKIIRYYICFALLLCAGQAAFSQLPVYAATKEKVYVQTSHVFFKPGETMYFKVYVVSAKDQTPSPLSKVVYVDIVSPSGNVLQKLNYKVEDGYAEGSFGFNEQATGGIYKIRAYSNWMRNEKDSSFFVKQVTVQKIIAPRLLMKLDFPEKGYGPGDVVKARFSIRTLTDQPLRNHAADYTVSIGGKLVRTLSFSTDDQGKADIRFTLPESLQTNDGLLNITVKYDAYTESIARSIPIVLNKIDLQFMPEGGTLVAGLRTQVAFRAVNENGKPVDIKGSVVDDRGQTAATFESYRFGMGRFPFTAQPGRSYTARIDAPAGIAQSFGLPAIAKKGIVMNISKADKRLSVKLLSTTGATVRLVGESRNTGYYTQNLSLQPGENSIDVDEGAFPAGIARFTVYNMDNRPLAERLVFMNDDRRLQVSVTPDKPVYTPREKVRLSITTKDENGRPLPSNLSIAVVDDKLWTLADDKQDNILSWLLMSSELRGPIEEPAFYFKKDEPKAVESLDLVMLTHGYRYFDYTEEAQKPGTPPFVPEQSNIMAGLVLDAQGRGVQSDVFLVSPVPGEKATRFRTANDGVFFFSELSPNSNYYLLAGSVSKKENISIRVLQNGDGYNPIRLSELVKGLPSPDIQGIPGVAPLAKAQDKAAAPPAFQPDMNRDLALNEVVVIGYGTQLRKDVTGAVTVVRGADLPAANIAMALEGRAAGVEIIQQGNPGAAATVQIRGMNTLNGGRQPLFVLDGVPIEPFNLGTVNPADINNITIFKDAAATAIYGSRAAYGVVMIETKKTWNEKIRFDLGPRIHYTSLFVRSGGPAYSARRRFYAPRYSHEAHEKTDFRETIYWNPVVQTDRNGNATVAFYNSDASTTFRAIVEGIGYNGKAGHAEHTYAARSTLAVDAKLPPYLTVGDKALAPLVIKNNGAETLDINLHLQLPDKLKAGKYEGQISLPAGGSQSINIPLEATAALNGNIRFIVESSQGKETLTLPVTATDKGFPVIQTISGNRPGQHAFDIDKVVPGTLKANLQLFTHLEGQLLDGIESMLREPSGCFEQTSSTTYPNVFILKYLKTGGQSNPAVEKKAMEYIERGYKRLVGFETSQNGFEWFGHAPAHEALTAYGLLEFTDMQDFVDVDKAMLERTKRYLLSRRDGNGSFKLASGGYDRFASVPNKIADIYIVYAMTQAGMGREIVPEYRAAVKKALAGHDGYQLAMMALAASNMKNDGDYQQLMDMLDGQYRQKSLRSETSVVNSRDASLRVETMSLYALALLRKHNPDLGMVADVISTILGEKSYYGYGSTQATVLALHAIVEYSLLRGRVTEENGVQFTLNDKPVSDGEQALAALRNGANRFAIDYTGKGNTIPFNLEVSYTTLTPPNNGQPELTLHTQLANPQPRIGETVRMDVAVTNEKNELQPMTIAKIGIPAGLAAQPWQLKEIMEKNEVAYYEIFDNYLVLYWMGFAPRETKTIHLDLKAEIPGTYKGKAGTVYLYYTPEHKYWTEGPEADIKP